ncbi:MULTISPECIES: hypothetical protein [unclassified Caballeronia]|uniref:hypothetical protein n=1 Tax=unclassified Caballeronia TaxID=2646786 RepID=UPI0020294E73|nr:MULTISPECIES: hypothetical protein [unclassified Caballeronia]
MRGLILNSFLTLSMALGTGLPGASAYAQDVDREQLIQQFVKLQQGERAGAVEMQIARMILLKAPQANPNVTRERWLAIQADVNAAIDGVVAQGGDITGSLLRDGLANLSDEELQRLVLIYRDPVYIKYMSTMSSPIVLAKIEQRSQMTARQMSALVNSILEKNGLARVQ